MLENNNVTPINEGCRLHGHLEVNKVAGNFHIAPGQSFEQHHVHIHSLRNIRFNMINTTHYIDELAFGKNFPNQINPLSKTKQIATNRDNTALLYHYYVKIVPSTYIFLNQTQLLTNQYSVTKHKKIINNIYDSSDHQLPGTFFTYEISAIMVKFIERKRSLVHFLTSLCAIIVSYIILIVLRIDNFFLHFREVFLLFQVLLMHFYIIVVVFYIENSNLAKQYN